MNPHLYEPSIEKELKRHQEEVDGIYATFAAFLFFCFLFTFLILSI